MKIPDDLWRVALGAVAAAAFAAVLIGLFFFVMFGFDSGAIGVVARTLKSTAPAALLIGVPLYLLVRRVLPGLVGLTASGAVAAIGWAAVSSNASVDPYLYAMASLLGGVSAMVAYPIVAARGRSVRPLDAGR